jgi:MFS family permease
MVVASMVALNTALGDIAVATGATQTQLTWIVDSYTLLLACLLLPAGAIGDRYGRRTALLVGLAIFAGASLAPLILGSPTQIIAARALAGAGAAFVMPATLSPLGVAYPVEARTKEVGVWAGLPGQGESSACSGRACCCGCGDGCRSSGPHGRRLAEKTVCRGDAPVR